LSLNQFCEPVVSSFPPAAALARDAEVASGGSVFMACRANVFALCLCVFLFEPTSHDQ